MEKMLFSSVFVVLAVYQMPKTGVEALQCYDCSDCGDPFKSNGVSTTTCSSCMKVKGEHYGIQYVERGCEIEADDGCFEGTLEGIKVYFCTCSTNLCNGAALPSLYALFVVTMTKVMMLAKKLLE